jgi:hypothetical protein
MTSPLLYDLYSPFQYPWMSMNYFMVLWASAQIIRHVLTRMEATKHVFADLQEDKKRNAITYVILFVGTTFAFGCQVYGGYDILFRGQDITSMERLNWCVMSIQCIVVLYIWELCFREKIGLPLLFHHLCTILLAQLVTATFFDTHNLIYIRLALMMGLHASTEQISFFSLFVLRLNFLRKHHKMLFLLSAAQTFCIKTTLFLGSTVWFFRIVLRGDLLPNVGWGLFWTISFVPLNVALYGAQLYASKILYVIACRHTAIPPSCYLDHTDDDEDRVGKKELSGDDIGVTNSTKAAVGDDAVFDDNDYYSEEGGMSFGA